MSKKNYEYENINEELDNKPENVPSEDKSVTDYITGKLVKSGVKEHEEAVNVFARKLVEELGYSKNQIQTLPQFRAKESPSGRPKYPVDIVVYHDEINKSYDNVYMIVECKQPNKKDGRNQLDIYLNLVPSAEIGAWFNGKEHIYLWKVQDPKTKRPIWKEIPSIPKEGQRVEDIGHNLKKDLIVPSDLKSIFKDIRNHLVGTTTGITRDETIAQQIINLLFCKIYDEINTPLDESVTFCAKANDTPKDVKNRIEDLFTKVKTQYNDVFDMSDTIDLDAKSVSYVVGELQDYIITKANRDAIAEAFEIFIGPALRGSEGQFFTPRNVIKLIIELIDPNIDEYIIDPACGSGGFLIAALEHVWTKLNEKAKNLGWSNETLVSERIRLASKYIAGIDKDSFLAKVTKAYMALIGDGRGGIFCENALNPPSEWSHKTRDKIKLGTFDVVVTNPPFGAKIAVKGEGEGGEILKQYDLAHKWKYEDSKQIWEKTNDLWDKQPPQILFIERCLQLLKPHGRMAIILPETYLHATNSQYILSFLKRHKILHIVDLSHNTFRPHNNAKTVVVILEKLEEGETLTDYKILFSIAEKVGHDHTGNPLYKIDMTTGNEICEPALDPITKETRQKRVIDDDIPEIIKVFKEYKAGKEITPSSLLFSVNYKDINPNILVPRYYWREYEDTLKAYIKNNNACPVTLGELEEKEIIKVYDGHGSPASVFKGKGDVPYVRVADIINCEVYKNPTSLVPMYTYKKLKGKNGVNLQCGDILFVRRGSYRIGSVAIVSPFDEDVLLTKEILVFKVIKQDNEYGITPYYLLYLLNLDVVQQQIHNKVLIETTLPNIGDRWRELALPIHQDSSIRNNISNEIQESFALKWITTLKLECLQNHANNYLASYRARLDDMVNKYTEYFNSPKVKAIIDEEKKKSINLPCPLCPPT